MDKRLLKKPKYKIGDAVAYRESTEDGVICIAIHEIMSIYGYIKKNQNYTYTWVYELKQVVSNSLLVEPIEEYQILYKL